MGYYSERLRQRLEKMTQEEKMALWDKYSYLSEYGPVISNQIDSFYYGEVLSFASVSVSLSVPEFDHCAKEERFSLAA